MYIPKHFKPQELVPPDIFKALGGSKSLSLIDERVLITLDKLRETFGIVTVNDWCFGGHYQQSGLRTVDSPYYSPTSQHTFGRAADCKFKQHSAETVRETIIDNKRFSPISAL